MATQVQNESRREGSVELLAIIYSVVMLAAMAIGVYGLISLLSLAATLQSPTLGGL
jgi:hypothetical protein